MILYWSIALWPGKKSELNGSNVPWYDRNALQIKNKKNTQTHVPKRERDGPKQVRNTLQKELTYTCEFYTRQIFGL